MAVWVALGMLHLHLHLHLRFTDALDLLRGYAYSRDPLLDDVTHALIDRTRPVDQLAL